jgi:ferric-dicitrate binding protein FerR (iron transport regulator)
MNAYLAAHRRAIHCAERQSLSLVPQQPEPANFCASNDDTHVPPPLTRRQLVVVAVIWCAAMAASCWLAGWL